MEYLDPYNLAITILHFLQRSLYDSHVFLHVLNTSAAGYIYPTTQLTKYIFYTHIFIIFLTCQTDPLLDYLDKTHTVYYSKFPTNISRYISTTRFSAHTLHTLFTHFHISCTYISHLIANLSNWSPAGIFGPNTSTWLLS